MTILWQLLVSLKFGDMATEASAEVAEGDAKAVAADPAPAAGGGGGAAAAAAPAEVVAGVAAGAAAPAVPPWATDHDRKQARRTSQRTRDDCLRQLEFYLCDANLPYDDFYRGSMGDDGAIECDVLANSNRIKDEYAPLLTPRQRAFLLWDVAGASDTVARSGDRRVRRRHPLPGDDPSVPSLVYAELCPQDAAAALLGSGARALADALEARADAAAFAPVVDVRTIRALRQSRERSGAVLVELETPEKAAALLKVFEASKPGGLHPPLLAGTRISVRNASTGAAHFERLDADCRAFKEAGNRTRAARAAGQGGRGGGDDDRRGDDGASAKRARDDGPSPGAILAFDGARERRLAPS